MQMIIGIDEAGRGPLAGPVSVGAFLASEDFDFSVLPFLGDSKKVTEKRRREIFKIIIDLEKKGEARFAYALISAKDIDARGIVRAIQKGIDSVLKKLEATEKHKIFLDGGIRAPKEFPLQETVIKGDAKIPFISAASIVAKVVRDEYMTQIASKYPDYGFEVHKGYGTAKHIEVVKKKGLSEIHRKSFCRGF